MIGLDTNVLVRYLVQDDPAQGKAAADYISGHCSEDEPGYVGAVVLAELAWVLSRAYGYGREEVAKILDLILRTNQLEVEAPETVWTALAAYRAGTADFADALIGERNSAAGCGTTITFDVKASRLPTFTMLPS